MKMKLGSLAVLVVLVLMAGCQINPGSAMVLPEDSLHFTVRSEDQFLFESVRPTELGLQLVAYDMEGDQAQPFVPEDPEGALIFVVIRDESGNEIHIDGVAPGEILLSELVLPTEQQDFTVTVGGPLYEERTLPLDGLNRYESVTGSISIAKKPEGKNLGDEPDADGDGVPDHYDAYPQDKVLAFSSRVPAVKMLTIAFEDNYPNLGDGDYNDFVASYFIEEAWSLDGHIRILLGQTRALARVAGFDHRFGMRIEFEDYFGLLQVSNLDDQGLMSEPELFEVQDFADITLFEHTQQALGGERGHQAVFALLLVYYGDGEPESGGIKTQWNIYDPYLYVHNTSCDIHLMGKDPLPDSQNPNEPDGFIDENGYPRALLVPDDWGYPQETIHIETAYIDFFDWRLSGGKDHSDWYLNPDEQQVVFIDPELPEALIDSALIVELETELETFFPGAIP